MNKVILIGNVGKDPETRKTQDGIPYSRFSLATTKRYTDRSGEKKSDTQWHNLVAWRGIAEVIDKYVRKGDKLAVVGEVTYRQWEDNDGQKRDITEVVISDIEMLSSRTLTEKESAPKPEQETPSDVRPSPEGKQDDLPF